jgi:hypothetical protein
VDIREGWRVHPPLAAGRLACTYCRNTLAARYAAQHENHVSWLIFPGAPRATRAGTAVTLIAALLLPMRFVHGAVPDYKLGDIALEDIVTPVPLVVPHPEATDALKENVAQQAPSIVRFKPQAASEAESELRASVAAARKRLITALDALQDRPAVESDLDTPVYNAALAYAVNNSTMHLPLNELAHLWLRGQNDEPFVDSLLKPLREVMAQPIIAADKSETPLPPNRPVRLISVSGFLDPIKVDGFELHGQSISPGKFITLWRAQRLVETRFPAGEEQYGRFVASFVRPNVSYDPALTEVVRAKRTTGFAVNDTFEAADVVVQKGQVIDRKALSALAVLREKSLIGSLQSKLDQEQSVAGQIESQTQWLMTGLGVMAVTLMIILWRLRSRPVAVLPPLMGPALPGTSQHTLPSGSPEEAWQARALLAEGKAERAHAAIRSGVLGWMRDKIFRTMADQRAELLSSQQRAETEMRELEQRLAELHAPLQDKISAYEKRIAELEQELVAKKRAFEAVRPIVTVHEDVDRNTQRKEMTLAERERDIGETEIRLAEQARDLDELAALLRAREALLQSQPTLARTHQPGRVIARGAEPIIQLKN